MKKTKAKAIKRQQPRAIPKSTNRQRPYEKAAIRSQAFAKAIVDAKFYATDPQRLRDLFEEASRKAAAIRRNRSKIPGLTFSQCFVCFAPIFEANTEMFLRVRF